MNSRYIKRPIHKIVAITSVALVLSATSLAQDAAQPAPQDPPLFAQAAAQPLSSELLDSLVSPIALYLDPLLSQVLVASTYPLEIVEANQWLHDHPSLTGSNLTDAARQQDWDPSVQALVAFPDVINRLSQNIKWTTDLGNAFLAQQGDVMDAVQRMRARAKKSGKLKSTSEEGVVTLVDGDRTIVEIEPRNPDIVYVPVYDPALIWGPLAFPYPAFYYAPLPPGVVISFGIGVPLRTYFSGCCTWGAWGWGPNWVNHTVIVNNTFFYHYGFNRVIAGRPVYSMRGTTVWVHNPAHRLGVPYPTRQLASRYHDPDRGRIEPEKSHPAVGRGPRRDGGGGAHIHMGSKLQRSHR